MLELSEDERGIVETVTRLCREKIAPRAAAIDEKELWVGASLADLATVGMCGANLPSEHGGAGLAPPTLFQAVAAVAGACGSTASALTAHYLATDAILIGGDDAQRRRYLPDAARGRTLGAFALTEPQAGSNPADMRCRATTCSGGYRLTGTKHFISNGGVADFVVVFALTGPAAGARGISAFVVEKGTPGFQVVRREPTMGLRGGHIFELGFDCEVPAANRIGAEGSGFRTAMRVLDNGRVEVAAMCCGIAEAACLAARDWSRQRIVGGHPLADNQGVQWMLADMATDLEAARLLGLRAAALRGEGRRFSREAAMAKLFASEMAGRVTDKALQLHGGYGYARALPLERYARDVRVMRIYEGSSEIQRTIIARALLADTS